jgi:hypothetical protein
VNVFAGTPTEKLEADLIHFDKTGGGLTTQLDWSDGPAGCRPGAVIAEDLNSAMRMAKEIALAQPNHHVVISKVKAARTPRKRPVADMSRVAN